MIVKRKNSSVVNVRTCSSRYCSCFVEFTKMSVSSKSKDFYNFCSFIFTIVIFTKLIYSTKAEYQNTNNWESFKVAHMLDPVVESDSDYLYWTQKDWKEWFALRKPLLEKVIIKHDVTQNSVRHAPLKHIDAVVVANSNEILNAFIGKLTPYGRRNQAIVWSRVPFTTFVIQRAGKAFHVYNCGKIFIAVRLYKGKPVHLQDYYPEVIRNPFGGQLLYPVSQNCKRIYRRQHFQSRLSRQPLDNNIING